MLIIDGGLPEMLPVAVVMALFSLQTLTEREREREI